MRKCKVCKVPLSGALSAISKLLFRVKPSASDPAVCNKCVEAPKETSPQDAVEPKKYKCEICQRMIDEDRGLEHVKAEEYIIELIKKDHPQWRDKTATCKECLDYYRRLVNEAEV